MPSAFQKNTADLHATLLAIDGRAITFTRGTNAVSLTALPDRSDFQQDDGNGMATEFRSRDWIVPAASLVLAGAIVLPQRGDIVTTSEAGQTQTYEVLSPPYRPSGPANTRLRIHTKLVKAT